LIRAGRVGRPHGRDGSFYVEDASHPLAEGDQVQVGEELRTVERRAGTEERPLVRLTGVAEREGAAALRGQDLILPDEVEGPLAEDEWLAEDLVGLRVEGAEKVRRVLDGPSCSLLELEDGTLVPLISDAVREVDLEGGVIRADLRFLGVES
jgi:16S rRNA processing protein RimM